MVDHTVEIFEDEEDVDVSAEDVVEVMLEGEVDLALLEVELLVLRQVIPEQEVGRVENI